MARKAKPKFRVVNLGVIEFHSDSFNPGLRERFFAVTDDLRASASIVDLWLLDIQTVLAEFGYKMTVETARPLPNRPFAGRERGERRKR